MIKEIEFFISGLINKEFNSQSWKQFPARRRMYLKDIFNRRLLIGKTQEEAEQLLGKEKNNYGGDRWHYPIDTVWWVKKKYYLILYLEDSKVVNIKLASKKKKRI